MRVALLSLEPWDGVWRRNQHLAAQLVASGRVESLLFVTPPRGGLALRAPAHRPLPGIEVVTPPLVVPRRYGGHEVLGAWVRRRLAPVDVVWINDPVTGARAMRHATPAVYDVTDDWRTMAQGARERARIVAAEDVLARRAVTIVCSAELAQRWRQRYAVRPELIPNAVDAGADVLPLVLDGQAPHAVYVGTLHANRLDTDLIVDFAAGWAGVVHLVGPDHLDRADRARLDAAGARRHGAVDHREVLRWMNAADVLVCPHVVDDFTLSLDAIKAHEYLSTDRPVVATPSSGFQSLRAPGLTVVDRSGFGAAAQASIGATYSRPARASWSDRAAAFATVLERVRDA